MLYFVVLVMDQFLEMDTIFVLIIIQTPQIKIIQIYIVTNNQKIQE